MIGKSGWRSRVGLVALVVAAVTVAGCSTLPKGTTREATAGSVKIMATGAGIVKADAQQTVFKIKCGFCGYEPEPITIATPKPGQPYTYNFKCPRCGHKQKIVIRVAE